MDAGVLVVLDVVAAPDGAVVRAAGIATVEPRTAPVEATVGLRPREVVCRTPVVLDEDVGATLQAHGDARVVAAIVERLELLAPDVGEIRVVPVVVADVHGHVEVAARDPVLGVLRPLHLDGAVARPGTTLDHPLHRVADDEGIVAPLVVVVPPPAETRLGLDVDRRVRDDRVVATELVAERKRGDRRGRRGRRRATSTSAVTSAGGRVDDGRRVRRRVRAAAAGREAHDEHEAGDAEQHRELPVLVLPHG